jgi:hypothetical protein
VRTRGHLRGINRSLALPNLAVADFTPIWWTLLAVWLASYALAARWVWRDARRRGYDPLRALALVSLLWPVGLSLWVMLRSGLHLAPEGWGSAWG